MQIRAKLILVVGILIMMLASVAQAQSGGGYELRWTSIDTGGGAMTGGAYSLTSTIGQPEPGATQNGGNYGLNGGVVDAGKSGQTTTGERRVYVPLILR